MHELGSVVNSPEHEWVRDLLLPYLTDLYESTHHTVHLASLVGTDVVYLAKIYGHRSAVAPSRIGGTLPAHATAVGKVLLAYRSLAAARTLSAPLNALTAHTITDVAELSAELGAIRLRGVAYDHQESRVGLCCVAAPVLGRRGRALAALSVSGVHGQLDIHRCEASLRRVCARASSALSRVQLPRSM
ncbi:IclR family transcriptional regulator [Nocardia sp. CA-120079]|uniref:IclR family transcriptional regulator n=1 Tax=Nocardia sp. CA-120079 TaxID=3239974 RepID=UPI003D99CD0F